MMTADDIRTLAAFGIDLRGWLSPALQPLLRKILAIPNPTITFSDRIAAASEGDGRELPRPYVSLPMGSLTSTSLNWSGAVCSSRGERFRHVVGEVKMPPEPAPPAAPRENRDYRCSIWVGMGGHRRWDKSLPQVGVMTGFRTGSDRPFLYAWEEWFLGTSTDPYKVMDQFPIAWGDDIILGVFSGPSLTEVTTLFVNLSQAHIHVGGLISERELTGVSAEWIVERPSPWECLAKPYPLFNYGEVRFENCMAFARFDGEVRMIGGARMVRLVERRTDPSRTHFVSVPEPHADNGIAVRYRP